jgi:Na+/H+ antiporter NhaA
MKSIHGWLQVIILGSLALYLVIGVVVWSWMILSGVPAPGGFTTMLGAVAGALAGIASPLHGPTSTTDADPGGSDLASDAELRSPRGTHPGTSSALPHQR